MTITDNRQTRIGEATVAEFAAGLRGKAVRPGDEDYDRERSIWNGAHDRRPAVIARAAGVADVIRTVDLARSEGLPLAVRGGGHSIPGFSTVDDGIVLDLSLMKGIRVDPQRRRVTAEAGGTWKDLDAETQQFGLAVTGGLVSSTGIAGFTTGGGIGWLMRKHGLAADNLVAADVVTADGQFVHASADENPELFWGLRGGGGNFGVVTSFEFQLHEVGPTVLAGLVFYPAEEAEQVLRGYLAAAAAAPDELTTLVNMTTAPPVPFLPESVHGKPIVALGAVYSGPLDAGDDVVRPLRTLADPVADLLGPVPYAAMQQMLDPLWQAGAHNYFTSAMMDDLPDPAVEELIARWSAKPTPQSEIHVHHAGGALARVSASASAFSQRTSPYLLNVIARSVDGVGFDDDAAWARGTRAALAAYGPDTMYVNFTGEAGDDKVRASYPPETYAKLVSIKKRYDPTNVFRLNQNIPPTAQAG